MGGHAFGEGYSFPRMPPQVYQALKARLLPEIEKLYLHVQSPVEAPEKKDHGDLDISVASPRTSTPREGADNEIAVPAEIVKKAIGATLCNPQGGNRTSNFAVPVQLGEWAALGFGEMEDALRAASEDGNIYYQVDVHVCENKEEWERIVLFNSYGDLGMIMGLIAKNVGLTFGTKGLKLENQPLPPILLSQDFAQVFEFFGWSMETRKAGLITQHEVFQWAATSRFYNPKSFRLEGEGIKSVKPDRRMYQEFCSWVHKQSVASEGPLIPPGTEDYRQRKARVKEEALVFFGKKEEFEQINRVAAARSRLKLVFTGSRVRDWCGLGEHRVGVKKVMDRVREQHGGDQGVLAIYDDDGIESVQKLVLDAMKQLNLDSAEEHARKTEGSDKSPS